MTDEDATKLTDAEKEKVTAIDDNLANFRYLPGGGKESDWAEHEKFIADLVARGVKLDLQKEL